MQYDLGWKYINYNREVSFYRSWPFPTQDSKLLYWIASLTFSLRENCSVYFFIHKTSLWLGNGKRSRQTTIKVSHTEQPKRYYYTLSFYLFSACIPVDKGLNYDYFFTRPLYNRLAHLNNKPQPIRSYIYYPRFSVNTVHKRLCAFF